MREQVAHMSVSSKAETALQKAREVAAHVDTWADFSLLMFDQESGIVARLFPSGIERAAFFDSPEYEEINKIQMQLMRRTGMVRGAKPRLPEKSGRFNVRVPKTLHQILDIEAKGEKVSLNQLVLTKLSMPLRSTLQDRESVLVIRAFGDVHDGYAIDRIVVDPAYNGKFLRRCRELGLSQPDVELNHALYDIRKSKKKRDSAGIVIPPTTKKTEFRDFDDYQFASEIAVRVLQRTKGVSLDRIMCDPVLTAEFDAIAQSLVNQIVLKLRWAALNLRKTHRLQPIDKDLTEYDLVSKGPVKSIDLSSVSEFPALYVFFDQTRPIYAGETENLRKRMQYHLQYGIPCVDLRSDEGVTLKTFEMPRATTEDRRRWLMAFITREHPLLNYQKAA